MLEYWYNENTSDTFRHHSLDIINLKFTNTPVGDNLSFKEECVKTAIELHKEFPHLCIGLSAGWESQIIFQSFLEAGIKPNVFIIEFPYKLNVFDSYFAKESCKHAGIVPEIFNPDLKSISELETVPLAEKYQLYSFFDVLLAKYAEELKTDVLIGDHLDFRRDVHPNAKWTMTLNENMWAGRFNSLNDKKVVNNFFVRNTNIIRSFINNPKVQEVISNRVEGKISLNSSKKLIYGMEGFYKKSEANKTLSTLNIKKLEATANEKIEKTIGFYSSRNMYIEYQDLVNTLEEQEKVWKFV